QPVEHRHPFRPPAFGGFGNQRVDAIEPFDRFLRQRRRELAQIVGRFSIGPLVLEKRLGGPGDIAACELPLIQDLQRRFARAVAAIFLLHAWRTPGRDSCETTSAISRAATAASYPLLPGP